MSQRSFNRELKRFGTSFRDLKLDVIEEIAKRALAETAASVSEIALNLGYSETTAFDRVFKKQTGVTPSAYRKLIDRGMSDSPSPPF
jgi:AraC-like DNA-binding protein